MTLELLPLAAFALSFGLLAVLYPRLLNAKLVAHPEARSNHTKPTVTGGGLAIVVAALPLMWWAGLPVPMVALAALLCVISFIDDIRPLAARARLLAQFSAVGVALALMFPQLQIVPVWAAMAFFAWVWWVNLTNFMDGIDEISWQQHGINLLGVAILFAYGTQGQGDLVAQCLILAAAIAPFFFWNKHPARMFMGDAGSIPIGFLTGYMYLTLLSTEQAALMAGALILPAYYVTDATSTLLKRVAQGKNPAQAHSEHAYQHAVRSGKPHSTISRRLALLNLALVFVSVAVLYRPEWAWGALGTAYFVCVCVCLCMRRMKPSENT